MVNPYILKSPVIDKGLLYEYINIHSGAAKNFSSAYFSGGPSRNHEIALRVIKYAVEIFLHWTPEEVKNYLNKDVIEDMKLKRVMSYISFPPGLDPNKDYWYIAHMLYPDELPFSMEDVTLFVYKRLLRGIESGKSVKIPKFMFDNHDGRQRAQLCFRYLLSHYIPFKTPEDAYAFFASSRGEQELNKYGLTLVWKNIFGSPVSFLHNSLPQEKRNDFLYHYYEFQYRYREMNSNRKRFKVINDVNKFHYMVDLIPEDAKKQEG